MSDNSFYPVLGKDDVYPVVTHDGSNTLFSRAASTTYHSIYGAVSESKHTFIQKGLLTQISKEVISVLEFGFGTGLNAFLAFLFSKKHKHEVQYTGLECFPLEVSIIDSLQYPEYLAVPHLKDALLKMHLQKTFREDLFQFSKVYDLSMIPVEARFDCIFFDAFDPGIQSELWRQDIFDQLFNVTSHDGCLVTYCSKGVVRRAMEQSGFKVSRIPGAPGKRQMLQAFRCG